MRVRRTLAALCAVVPLAWAAAGCSDTSAGQVIGTRGVTFRQTISNPVHDKCHSFAPSGVDQVTNDTGVDIVLHKGPDCSDPAGRPSFYLVATYSTTAVARLGLYRSFTTVGWPPPVPAA